MNTPAAGSPRALAWPLAAACACFIFGVIFILNVQLSGDSEWFYYATLYHHGTRLYADLHLVLQPFFILETNAWMQLAGTRCIPYESLSLLHVAALCCGMVLLLRESTWPGWQRALVLCGAFFTIISFDGYRFDDFHIVADNLFLYAMVLLLWLARARSRRRLYLLTAALGLLCGLAITNRSTDGGLLTLAVLACLLFLARTQKLLTITFLAATLLTWLLIVRLTGDTLHDYLTNSVFHAASAKGGSSHVLLGPFTALQDTARRLRHGNKRELLAVAALVLAGYITHRFWKKDARLITFVEVALALLLGFAFGPHTLWSALLHGSLIGVLSTVGQPATYGLGLWVLLRAWRSHRNATPWDPRETLIFVPVATLLAIALSQANGTSNSNVTIAYVFLLTTVLIHPRTAASWRAASFTAIVALIGVTGLVHKSQHPSAWGPFIDAPLFTHRQVYQHPLRGTMYLDRDLLAFELPLCAQINTTPPADRTLLSIPFPYTNYFCGVPPWHNYVQTWYDTVTPATIDTLMAELNTAPPAWVLYQRQPDVLHVHEVEYNHGNPIAHRFLDDLILRKLATGHWQLVQKTHYLPGDAWYLIRTTPAPPR